MQLYFRINKIKKIEKFYKSKRLDFKRLSFKKLTFNKTNKS